MLDVEYGYDIENIGKNYVIKKILFMVIFKLKIICILRFFLTYFENFCVKWKEIYVFF